MPTLNEVKEQIAVVGSVGDFANALQQIAAMRMVALRDQVWNSKRFVDEVTEILKELKYYRELLFLEEYERTSKKAFGKNEKKEEKPIKDAVMVVSSNQGLCGRFNAEIFKKMENYIFPRNPDADYYLLGKKCQEHYLSSKRFKLKFFPYNVPDNFTAKDLIRLTGVFSHYNKIILIYTRYINTVNSQVVETLLVTPPTPIEKQKKGDKVQYLFEPSIEDLIIDASAKLRAAAFQQQILDSRLAQYSAQMVGMQGASENAKVMLDDLGHEYNKQRRKMIDKKIGEVFAGSALW